MKLTLHPGAEQDLEDVAAFYEREGTPMLSARFVTEFKLRVLHECLSCTVVYRVTTNEIRVLVVKHDISLCAKAAPSPQDAQVKC